MSQSDQSGWALGVTLKCICGETLRGFEPGVGVRCPKCDRLIGSKFTSAAFEQDEHKDDFLLRWRCECGNKLKAPKSKSGMKGKCPKCGAHIVVPFPEDLEEKEEPKPELDFLDDRGDEFGGAFLVPLRIEMLDHDHHFNPVVQRDGMRFDVDAGWPFEIWHRDLLIEFVLIPPGQSQMGSPDTEDGRGDEEGPQRTVRIRKPFYIAKYPISQEQWSQVTGAKPWETDKDARDRPEHPAVCVSWRDCQEFIAKLNKDSKTNLLRLPKEEEWEYAARGGTQTPFSFGTDPGDLAAHAWFYENTCGVGDRYAKQIGLMAPNPFGLYDVHGNVYEWCQDSYGYYRGHENYYEYKQTHGDDWKVIRGGSFLCDWPMCRSAHRLLFRQDMGQCGLGLRPVLDLPRSR